jgi:hypothetical protein
VDHVVHGDVVHMRSALRRHLIWFPVSSYPYCCSTSLAPNHPAEEHRDAQSDATDDRTRRRMTTPPAERTGPQEAATAPGLLSWPPAAKHATATRLPPCSGHRQRIAARLRACAQGGVDHTLRSQRPQPPVPQRSTAPAVAALPTKLQDPHGGAGSRPRQVWVAAEQQGSLA